MKPSIEKIFKNLNFFLLLSLILSFIISLFVVEQLYSYQKFENLKEQKIILLEIINEKQKFDTINLIKFNANISILKFKIQNLITQNEYNYISKYLTLDMNEYNTQLYSLKDFIFIYDVKLRAYFEFEENTLENKKESFEIDKLSAEILKHIDTIIMKNISYDKNRFNIFLNIFAFLFLNLLFISIWYKNKLTNIHKDLLTLYTIDSDKNTKKFFFQETATINLKMKRKILISDNPNMIDSTTEIYNNKGMLQAYSEKRNANKQNFVCISILEIDNFSKSNRIFSQEFTQNILKKVAYTISLHEQATDIISRTDYNQFTLILSRDSKGQLFRDVESIRQSISKIKLASVEKKVINITVTGSFIIKIQSSSLEESIKKAKNLLENTKKITKNKIFQTKDIAK